MVFEPSVSFLPAAAQEDRKHRQFYLQKSEPVTQTFQMRSFSVATDDLSSLWDLSNWFGRLRFRTWNDKSIQSNSLPITQ